MPTTYTIPNGAQYMAATTYTGNSATSQAITNGVPGVAFAPDMVWIKARNNGYNHYLVDTVRGFSGSAARVIQPNLTTAEETDAANSGGAFKSFNTNGFNVGYPASGWAGTNENGTTYVGWNFKAGGTAVSNTAGSITSSVSANTTSGFSVVTYTGTSSVGTIGHGLGIAPSMIIVKSRNTTYNWTVYHQSIGATNALFLNTTAASTSSTDFNNTSPTSSVFSVGNGGATNGNASFTYVAYCWAAVAGYSAFGSYVGTGSADGPFIYTGFRPRFIMIKRSDSTSSWYICDTSINPYNEEKVTLYPNLSNAEGTNANFLDGLSNGFKMREAGLAVNGGTYIYAAFAENPFKYANAR